MIQPVKKLSALSIALTILLALAMVPTTWVAGAAPHKVSFVTTGLPAGVSITITGELTTNGGHLKVPYSITFLSPGPATVNTEPVTSFSYAGFPSPVDVNGQSYTLSSVTPASPFTTGAAGGTTEVTAAYGITCQPASITTHPAGATVTVGDPVTFTVSASGDAPLTYQWRKDGVNIDGATSSSYSIISVLSSDAGSYDVLVSNACTQTPIASNLAVLTVNKADQSITVTTSGPASAVYNTSFTVAATATSGLTVAYSASGDCTNLGATFTMTSGTGTCTVHYNQAGDANYNATTEVTEGVTADKASQTITFVQSPSPAFVNTTFVVNPTASSGLPVALVATGSCSNVGFQVTMTNGTGTCTLTASQAGDLNYAVATDVVRTVQASWRYIYLPIMSR